MRRDHLLWVGIASALALGLALGAAGWSMPPHVAPVLDREAAVALAGGDLRAESAAIHARVTTLAQLLRLAAAVATDEATVRDLTSDELAFRVRADETIQLSQRRADGLHPLLRLPAEAPPVALAPDASIAVDGDRLAFTEVSPIAGGATTGALAVRWRARPEDVFAQLAARTHARLVIDDRALDVGAPVAGPTVVVAVPDAAAAVTIELPATATREPAALALDLGAFAALLAAIALAARTLVPRRRRAAPPEAVPLAIPAARSTPFVAGSSTRLGRYEPGVLLGSGGTSSVFLARSLGDEGFEKKVALKVLRSDLAHDDRFRDMFLDEARLAAQISHPNVVQIFDLGRSGDDLFIAMEHIDGDDLESILAYQRAHERATPLPIALAILRRLCDGLHGAHTASDRDGAPLCLVHRDVKPGNVMISRNGEVKVGDFGIAKASQQLHISALGETKGTVAFMAPEQRMGRDVDARTDVFGVGAIAYELVAGATLDLDLARLLHRGLAGWPHLEPLAVHRPEAPAALEPILLAAMAYEPADRPASCAVLEAQLAAVMTAQGWNVGKRELATWLAGELAMRGIAQRRTTVDDSLVVEDARVT